MEVITLKNGEKIQLEWSFLTLQYLEDYEGGLKKLELDFKQKKNMLKIQSLFIYAAVRSNYDEVLGYQEAIRLVNIKDINKINEFISRSLQEQEEFKKKQQRYTQHKKKRKK